MAPEFNDAGIMTDASARFDLMREIADAEQQRPWQAGHTAKMLFKRSDFRVVLICMESAAQMKEHHADGTISVQVLKGAIRFTTQGRANELQTGQMLTLAPLIPHAVEALSDCAFLLTIAWPTQQELQAMGHQEYGP
ncbi:MAG: cupin domain-containing protein [Acidobacteriota bacterium]|nr:cupin domain-containing protein [Acidobacteriota bacterium]